MAASRFEPQGIVGFVLVILILAVILVFCLLTLDTVGDVLENREQVNQVVDSWHLDLHRLLQIQASGEVGARVPALAPDLDKLRAAFERVFALRVLRAAARVHPELAALLDQLRRSWPAIDRALADVAGLLSAQGQLPAAASTAAIAVDSNTAGRKALDRSIDSLLRLCTEFDAQVIALSDWVSGYSQQQLRAFRVLFCLLGTTIILTAALLIPMGVESADRRLSESMMRAQLQQVIRAQEEERRQISRDLHDGLAQELSTAKMTAETILEDLGPLAAGDLPRHARRLVNVLQESIDSTRALAYALRPPQFDHLGLVPALREYLGDIERSDGIKIDFLAAGMETVPIPYEQAINLYRIAQEAIGNVRRHSRASRVRVRLTASHPDIVLTVEDNGVGFSRARARAAAGSRRHMGIRSMRERAALLNGALTLRSVPDKGTRIVVTIPGPGGRRR